MSYQVGQVVTYNFPLFTPDDAETPVTGKLLADLQNLSLKLNGTTDRTSLLTMAEIGATGEYVLSFTPVAEGHYSLLFTEPTGTLEYHRSEIFEVLVASNIVTPITSLFDIVVSHVKVYDDILNATDINEAINSAIVGAFSSLSPKLAKYDIAGDSTTVLFDLSTLLLWKNGLSYMISIETPINEVPKTFLTDGVDYYVHTIPTVQLSLEDPIATGVSARILYTTMHLADGSDLSEYEVRQVAFLAAGYALEKAAAAFLNIYNANIGNAVSEFRSRSDEAATRSKEYLALFYAFWGGNGKSQAASSGPVALRVDVVEETDAEPRVRFTH